MRISQFNIKLLTWLVVVLPATAFAQVEFTAHDISSNADYIYSVYTEDIDGDRDMEVYS